MPRKSILVVDDDKPQRDILHDILTEAGYDVTSAASGEAALKFAKERDFDLALTDLKMTGMDGIELLQHLLTMDKSIIVILLTAHGTIESAKEALRRGAFDYLQKPFDRDALLATIKRALGTLDQIDVEILSADAQDGSGQENDSESRAVQLDRSDSRRIRHRQRADRPRDSQSISARVGNVSGSELRSHQRKPA